MRHIRTEIVTARKPAQCWGCCRVLPKGTQIEKSTWADDGKVSTSTWCATCRRMLNELEFLLDPMMDGYPFGCCVEEPELGFADMMYETEFWPS